MPLINGAVRAASARLGRAPKSLPLSEPFGSAVPSREIQAQILFFARGRAHSEALLFGLLRRYRSWLQRNTCLRRL
jgi:hypothetical protein